ncbi:hypothetical protein [Streptomyces sp. 7N604]|uniref:hypothetical protein n=1 Tax=Streptomyces sp. 7N604 TaxID=3457415 RepID=UPI003FCEF5C0
MAGTYDFPDFPDDLRDAQREIYRVRAELSALYARLPQYTESVAAFTDWRGHKRPACSERWSEGDWAAVTALRAQELELVTTVGTHDFWGTLEGPSRIAARMALKHVDDEQDDPVER